MNKKLETKIKEKVNKELTAIEDSIDYVCSIFTTKDDKNKYRAYWAKMLTIYENVAFFTDFDENSQVYRLKWSGIEGSELLSNIDYIANYQIYAPDKFVACDIEDRDGALYVKKTRVITSEVTDSPKMKEDTCYPVMITPMPDYTYMVIDGNHRVNQGERRAIIVPTMVFFKSLMSLYEIFMYLMDRNRWHYTYQGKSVERLLEENDRIISKIYSKRQLLRGRQ